MIRQPGSAGGASLAVRRILARDDLLLQARDAEEAVGIVRERDLLTRSGEEEPTLFMIALRHHLNAAGASDVPAVRGQALAYAGTIIRFCALVGIPLGDTDGPTGRHDPTRLYDRALRELSEPDHGNGGQRIARDLTLHVITTYRAIRDLRLDGEYTAALDLAVRPEDYFHGTGAEPYRGHFQYETGASLVLDGQAAQVRAAVGEAEREYWTSTRAAEFPTRHRFDYILGIAALDQADSAGAVRRLTAARDHLRRTRGQDYHDVQELSVTLALAECLAVGEPTDTRVRAALEVTDAALALAERIRSRWRVVARSRTPLAVAFRRVYGDIALLVSALPGEEAAKLGLRAGLSAKQTGFASRMRASSLLMSDHLSGLIEDIVRVEERPEDRVTGGEASREEELDRLRHELEDAVSPMLADTILPVPTDVARLRDVVGTRYALDFVELPDTLGGATNWFRTLIQPDESIGFERFDPGAAFAAFFHDSGGRKAWRDRLKDTIFGEGPDWRGLGLELLPTALLDRLRAGTTDTPIELIISAHSLLSLLPWAALKIDDRGTRLVERAVITQCPVLTCLSYARIPPVAGPALVRLVSAHEGGVDIEQERMAWDLDAPGGRTVLSRCDVAPTSSPTALPGSLLAALADGEAGWRFLHIASHGDGTGLGQHLMLPERLTAAQALALRWPESVLMASCHVGKLVNPDDAEPLSFVMALLTGGSRCVVAGIDEIPDTSTGRIAARLVDQFRAGAGTVRLDIALREAQLASLKGPEVTWALLSAYTR